MMRRQKEKSTNSMNPAIKFLCYLIMAVVVIISIYPLLWVFLSSFKGDIAGSSGLSLPKELVFDGYISIFTKLKVHIYYFNSFVITIASTLISVLFVAMAAYVSGRMEFKGKSLVTFMFSTTLFIPSIAISFPIYRLTRSLGLYNTRAALIFVYSGLGIAVTYFIIRSYFLTIPMEMEEAAYMDGSGYTKTFFSIILPLAKPGLSTAGILVFLNNWNEFYFASLLLQDREVMTLPALLGQFKTAFSQDLSGMFSAIVVMVIPTIIIFCCFSETFVKSLTAGGVKG